MQVTEATLTAIGDEFRRLREAAGLSQEQAAAGVGVARWTVHRIETGKSARSEFGSVLAYARYLGHPLADMLAVQVPTPDGAAAAHADGEAA